MNVHCGSDTIIYNGGIITTTIVSTVIYFVLSASLLHLFVHGQTAISSFHCSHTPLPARGLARRLCYISQCFSEFYLYIPIISYYILLCLISTCCASVVGSIILYMCFVCYLWVHVCCT